MSPHLEHRLRQDHPLIFAHQSTQPEHSCLSRGIECGDGWYALIDSLCRTLQFDTDQAGAPQVVARQVKEKFGTLRFHTFIASERQRGMIAMAGEMSMRICEICGFPCERPTLSWSLSRCTAHRHD